MSPLKTILSTILFVFLLQISVAQPGKDGSLTVGTTGVVVNRYDVLAVSASAGTTSITVTNIGNLAGGAAGINNPYATSSLGYGDLIMIIKMQGATITATNDATYGAISSYNGTGTYELAWVEAVSGNTITLASALTNAFTVGSTNRVQVIRIPRLNSLTVGSGASITGTAWSGSYKGGVVALEVNGNATINGSITASGIGFRGAQLTTHTSQHTGKSDYATSTSTDAAIKGEGIAGYQNDLGTTFYGRGAPANGGGGGCAHNAGGGGGSNAGTGTWNGQGNPDLSGTNWNVAWNLESAGFSTNTSSGGGRGGYSYSLRAKDALLPGTGGNAWQGDDRRNVGGFGGRPLTYSGNTLFMGGGGGAGDQNNGAGSLGGNGGGIIYLHVTGSLNGSGSVVANGNSAANTVPGHNDAAGGGGGGGAIRLNVQGAAFGITAQAQGGKGGDVLITSDEAYGPGGGGGGGYISATPTAAITSSTNNGVNGITTSAALTEFLPNGATRGAPGVSAVAAFVATPSSPTWVVLPTGICISITEQNAQHKVQWTGDNESFISKYELEQSSNGKDWRVMITQVPFGNTNHAVYEIPVSEAINKTTYYRLKITAKTGQVLYSCIRTLRANSTGKNTLAQDAGSVFVYYSSKPDLIRVVDVNGRMMSQTMMEINSNYTVISKTAIPKGVYFIQLVSKKESKTYRLIN